MFAVIFVMAASYEGPWVELLSRPWWNDRWRLMALWVVAVVPLAGAGVVVIRDGVLDVLRRARVPDTVLTGRGRAAPAVMLGALLLAVVGVSNGLYLDRNTQRMAEAFTNGPAVSHAERWGFTRLSELVAPDALVMNDPYDGSPLMYALAGVRPVFAQALNEQLDLAGLNADRSLLYSSFRGIDTDPAVRELVRRTSITHAVVSNGLVYTAAGNAPEWSASARSSHGESLPHRLHHRVPGAARRPGGCDLVGDRRPTEEARDSRTSRARRRRAGPAFASRRIARAGRSPAA